MGCFEILQHPPSNCKAHILMPEVEQIRLLLRFMRTDCLYSVMVLSLTEHYNENWTKFCWK